MNEQAFLERVARRLGRAEPLTQRPARDAVGAPAFWRDYQLSADERVAKFAEELGKLGGQVDVCDSLAELKERLRRHLQDLGPAVVGVWGRRALAEFELDDVLAAYDVVVWGEAPAAAAAAATPAAGDAAADAGSAAERRALVERMATANVGITACDYAVADTGTVVLLSGPDRGRLVSLLPGVHIVLIKASQIRTRLGEVLAELDALAGVRTAADGTRADGGDASGGSAAAETGTAIVAGAEAGPPRWPSSVNFITGPSRSSDIENDLTIGIHGPAAVIALVWRGR
ncbi:MAG: lactate utilization protein [Alicyclobacillaceae bacterium]|nr:lactate utilization protein [Alicyclobacillaceae bacterium]